MTIMSKKCVVDDVIHKRAIELDEKVVYEHEKEVINYCTVR